MVVLLQFLHIILWLQGLVAFSEHGLMIRWWSLGSGWWDKLSRNLVPVQCTKLIFVPPWEGFSPNSFRTSIMESISRHDSQANTEVSSFQYNCAIIYFWALLSYLVSRWTLISQLVLLVTDKRQTEINKMHVEIKDKLLNWWREWQGFWIASTQALLLIVKKILNISIFEKLKLLQRAHMRHCGTRFEGSVRKCL